MPMAKGETAVIVPKKIMIKVESLREFSKDDDKA
jgi:hypothetical protein